MQYSVISMWQPSSNYPWMVVSCAHLFDVNKLKNWSYDSGESKPKTAKAA